jgi:WD40 repeat protein
MDIITPPPPEEEKQIESTASITSTIMLKIPPENMSVLREDFLESSVGLDMNEFLVAVISAMNIEDKYEMLLMVADLIDFFHLVDINGDGFMEWEEFVMFILDAVVKEPEKLKDERFDFKETRVVQSAAVRDSIVCAVMVPSLGKYIMGVGPIIQMFGADDKLQPSNTHLVYKFPIMGAGVDPNTKGGKHLTIVHMQYLEGQDVLAVLRSDMYIEFFKFLSRSNYSTETIECLGKIAMNKPCHKIAFRVSAHRKPRLLVIGTSPIIDSFLFVPMGSNGLASLSDHQTMAMHTDYVRDVITINQGPSRFIVSASLDKSVIFWDLDSMEFKFKRTGHTAGVESLAFGGKSLLFAGGFDYSILVWDITAAINKPLFVLKGGHFSSVERIVGLESIDRCASLDESGVLIWWDTSRNILSDSRIIDSVTCPEDHAHSFDIISDLPHFFEALHGVIFLAAGKRQHVFKLKDVSTHEAAPVCTLYSATLLSVFTVHTHEIIFWNIVSGDEYKSVKELVSVHVKITCATLDDRGRRIIVGDTSGTIRYYNCLNGHLIKVLDSVGVPIKQLIYSPDKNLMIMSENSDVIIIDDTIDVTVPGVDYALRSVHFSSGSMVADIVSITYSSALGLIATVDAMGLLIVWDYLFMTPDFMIANASGNDSEVGSIAFIEDFPLLLIADNSKNFSILTLETRSGSNKKKHLWRLESVLPVSEEGSGEGESESGVKTIGARAQPYGAKATQKYLNEGGEAKHMVVHVEEGEEEEGGEEEGGSKQVSHHSTEATDSFSIQSKVAQSTFPKTLQVRVVCGYDDGTISITNITSALRTINIGRYIDKDYVSEQLIYNPKGRCVKHIGDSDCRKILPSDTIQAMEKFSTCVVECVKACHRSAITCVQLIGGFQWILTASEDKCVMAWAIDGTYCGLLTRGSEMDKLFRKHWNNPEDMTTRNELRVAGATAMVEEIDLVEAAAERKRRNTHKVAEGLLQPSASKRQLLTTRDRGTHQGVLKDPRDLSRALESEALGGSGLLPVTAETINKSLRVVERFPDRSRLLCQLEEEITYEPSKKDITRLQLQFSASMPQVGLGATQNSVEGAKKKPIRKKKKKTKTRTSFEEGSSSMDKKYLRTIQIADECLSQNTANRRADDASTKLDKWAYANEIAEIDAQDPGNWEISSLNRLREMYANMHFELAKGGKISNDEEKILQQKLRLLCPRGDVPAYFAKLKSSFRERMRLKHGKGRGKSNGNGKGNGEGNGDDAAADVVGSAEYGVYDVQGGELVMVSGSGEGKEGKEEEGEEGVYRTDDYDASFAPREGLLADDTRGGGGGVVMVGQEQGSSVGVVSMADLLDVSLSRDDESISSTISVTSEGSSLKRKDRMKKDRVEGKEEWQERSQESVQHHLLRGRHPTSSSSSSSSPGQPKPTLEKPSTESTSSSSSSLPSRYMKQSSSSASSRNMTLQPSLSMKSLTTTTEKNKSTPLAVTMKAKGKSTTILDPPDFIARQRTNDLLLDFEKKMKKTEKNARKTARKTRKQTRLTKRAISSNTAALMDSVRYLTDPLTVSEKVSADFMRQEVSGKWGGKARSLVEESDRKQRVTETSQVSKPSMDDITRLLQRTSTFIADTYLEQQQKEEQLLARKSFGPYVSTELVQILELFKTFPKQNPSPEDTVLMAGNSPAEEMGDGHTTNPVYGCIDLADLVKHRWMRNRPYFKSFLDKVLLMKRPNMTAGMFITLNRVILQICPLMNRKDRRDLMEYFKIYRGPEVKLLPGDRLFSRAHRVQLKKIFDYFDTDRSGSIDRVEIRAALDKTKQDRMAMTGALSGQDEGYIEGSIDDSSIGSIISEAVSKSSQVHEQQQHEQSDDVTTTPSHELEEEEEEEGGAEMDFEGFLQLFGQLLLPTPREEDS